MKWMIPIFFASAVPCFLLISCAHPGGRDSHAGPPAKSKLDSGPATATASDGRVVFLKNCAHCHGADAHGDEGPDLHNIDWPEEQIAMRIRSGKKGQMTAFAGKLSPQQIGDVVVYLRTLK